MPRTFESVVVYEVHCCHSNCTDCDGKGESFLYDDWDEAAARVKRFLDGRKKHCNGSAIVDQTTMPKAEYEALPLDEDPV